MRPEEFLALIKPEDKFQFRMGRIDTAYVTGDPHILFDGESTVSVKTFKTINYSPGAGERVLLMRVGVTYVVLGTIGSSGPESDIERATSYARTFLFMGS